MRVWFCAGGTLGHVLPALAIIKKLQEKYSNWEISFVASQKERKFGLEKYKLKRIIYLDCYGFNRKKPLTAFKAYLGLQKSKKLLKDAWKSLPDLVIGMGGYVSGVGLIVAQNLGIPTLIHEQNSVLGLANRIASKKASSRLASFPLVKSRYKYRVIGNPRYDECLAYPKVLKLNLKPEILFVGGSLGAKFINTLADKFSLEQPGWTVTLITGERYYDEMKENKAINLVKSTNDPFYYLSRADVVVTRGGATTLFELMAFQKPSVIIPSPNVSHNHQYYNALSIIDDNHFMVLFTEKDFNFDRFRIKVEELRSQEIMPLIKYHPTEEVISEIEKLVENV